MRVFSITQTYIVTVATEQAPGVKGVAHKGSTTTVPLIVVVEVTVPDFSAVVLALKLLVCLPLKVKLSVAVLSVFFTFTKALVTKILGWLNSTVVPSIFGFSAQFAFA